MPKTSIVVPVYNVENYVEKCVKSVLSQTDQDWELLLIDDGSTDKSGAICDELAKKDSRIRVIHQENRGLGGARNTGIEAASGDWLLFSDSDDWFEPDALSSAISAAESTGADMAVFAFRSVDEAGKELAIFRENLPVDRALSPSEHKELLLIAPSACNKLYRRELFVRTSLRYPHRVWYEDVRTTTKLIPSCKKIVYTDSVGYNYLQRSGSIMNNVNLERNREIIDAFDDVLTWYKDKGLFEEYYNELKHLTLMHVYLTASVRVLRSDRRHPLIGEFRRFIQQQFPDYRKDIYLSSLTRNQRIALRLLEQRMYTLLFLIFKLK